MLGDAYVKDFATGNFHCGSAADFWSGRFLGREQFRFSSTYQLNADFQNVAGLAQGAAVRVGGVHQGTVHRIVLPSRPDQKVRVEMDLRDTTRAVIEKDSVAAIQTEGLVGDQYIEISFGTPGAPPVKNGDTIGAEAPLQISDMIKKTNALLDTAQGAMQNISQTTGNLDAISSKLNSGKGSVGELINSGSMYPHINAATANLQDDTEALKHNFLLRGFFKKRGYEDDADLNKNAIAELPATAPSKSFTHRASKLFDKADSAKLKNGKMLDDAGHFLEQNPFGLAVVASYADAKGDTAKERQVTAARSVAARDYLVAHFKLDDTTRIKTIGAGKSTDAPDGGELEVMVYPAGK